MNNAIIIKIIEEIRIRTGIGQYMILEEYCSYILSRERDLTEFTIPGSSVTIDKNELLYNMKKALRYNTDKDYDSLLVNTLLYYVSKDHLGKNFKFDENMNAIMSSIRKKVETISALYESMERPIPFSYERIFEILVYYLRIITNILSSDKEQIARYARADISPEAVIYTLNRKLTFDSLDTEWEKKRWDVFDKDISPLYLARINNYFRFILLTTYIRYCEIKDI